MMAKVVRTALLPALLCVWLTGSQASSEEGGSRADAMQEAYEKFTLAAKLSEPKSGFFGDCLTTARTIDAKLASIAVDGTEYIRYVPDAAALAGTAVIYVDVPPFAGVSSIADCAAAAKTAGAPMFKYGGGSECKLANVGYDLTTPAACEAGDQEAVFVRNP